jgi:hypothetical protein
MHDGNEIGFAPIAIDRKGRLARRPARRRAIVPASPAAVDEVFAGLARIESAHGPEPRSPLRPIEPAEFRDLTKELDRQHERLAQLLREIDGDTTASE